MSISEYPTYKGNIGNLLQHWVFVEVINTIAQSGIRHLRYFDAHTMSPYAKLSPNTINGNPELFKYVLSNAQPSDSRYEDGLNALRKSDIEYPNSIMFLKHFWKNDLAVTLCELDNQSAEDLRRWGKNWGICDKDVRQSDWRNEISDISIPDTEMILMSFDPYMIDCTTACNPRSNSGKMDIADVRAIGEKVGDTQKPCLLQISTYSANNNNPQKMVSERVAEELGQFGFRLASKVCADGNMMAMVFDRNMSESIHLGDLEQLFGSWLTKKKLLRQSSRLERNKIINESDESHRE